MSILSNATDHAQQQAHQARTSIIELATQALRLVNGIRAAEVRQAERALGWLGLQRRSSALRPVAWFVAGAAVAGAVVVAATPAAAPLRRRVVRFFREEADARTGTDGGTPSTVRDTPNGARSHETR